MSCETFSEELPGYASGILGAEERLHLEAHLRSCRVCQDEVRSFERLDRLLREGLPWVEPSPDLQQRFMSRLAAEIEAESAIEIEPEERGSWLSWLFQPWMVPALATAALAVFVLVGSFGGGEPPVRVARDPAPPAASEVASRPEPAPGTSVEAAAAEPVPAMAAAAKPRGKPTIPNELEEDPDLFVDFAIIRELEILQSTDPTFGAAG